MPYCTIQEVRDNSDKLEKVIDVPDPKITKAINASERIVKVDLSSLMSAIEIDEIGGNSNVIKTLTNYKATETILATLYGTTRKVDEVSDIQYWQKKYKDLLASILAGTTPIDIPDGSAATTAKDYPATSSGNKRFYPRKGVAGVYPDGVTDSYVDDRIK